MSTGMTPSERLWIIEAQERGTAVAAKVSDATASVAALEAKLSDMRNRVETLSRIVGSLVGQVGLFSGSPFDALPVLANGDFISATHQEFDYDRVLDCVATWDTRQERIAGFDRYDAWFRVHGRGVSIIIPSYNDHQILDRCLTSLERLREAYRSIRIIIADDASPSPEHHAFLNRVESDGVLVIRNPVNLGFAGNVNSALSLTGAEDIVLLNSDIEAEGLWLEALQYAAYASNSGIVGAKLLYPNRTIQHAGVHRNPAAPTWFDHYYRGQDEFFGPACVPSYQLAVTGACLYITNAAFRKIGHLDPAFPMAFEDVDYCLRAWKANERVLYYPYACLVHHESLTRGREQGMRELASQAHFWSKWQQAFDRRQQPYNDDCPDIVYVLEDTGIAGGHRNVFDQVNLLIDAGYDVRVWSLAGQPAWFDLRTSVRTFADFRALSAAMEPLDCVKVATWWNTAEAVWLSSVKNGEAAYLVSDIEGSYYVDSPFMRAKVISSYKFDFRFFTICEWNQEQLKKLGIDSHLVSCSVDSAVFRPLPNPRRSNVVLAPGRRNHLKNFQFTLNAWSALGNDRPSLWMYGGEPDVADFLENTRYFYKPSDEYLNSLINRSSVFVLTSRHEGFALTILEAMSAGTPVITTDCHGNRDFCIDGENCLVVKDGDYAAMNIAIRRLLRDTELRDRVVEGGFRAARKFSRAAMQAQLVDFFAGSPTLRRKQRVRSIT